MTDPSVLPLDGAGVVNGRLATVFLVALTSVAVYLWYRRVLGVSQQRWAGILELLDGEFSRWRIAIRGVSRGTPVFVRLDSESSPGFHISGEKASSRRTKCLYAVTMAFPVSGEADWSVVPVSEPEAGQEAVAWNVITEDEELKRKFEQGDVPRLLAECDYAARLVCNAKVGEVTLEYAAPDTTYCPDPDAFQRQLDLLRTAVGLWGQDKSSTVAA